MCYLIKLEHKGNELNKTETQTVERAKRTGLHHYFGLDFVWVYFSQNK